MDRKCVIIVDKNLPLGLIANTTAILGTALGKLEGEIVTIPVLKGDEFLIRELLKQANYYPNEVLVIDFCDLAQSCRDYSEYIDKMKLASEASLKYFGICLYGTRTRINKLTGNLSLLK